MVSISELPDDLLVKILSFLPTKSAASTSILSKRWEFLWMWLPKLEYRDLEITRSMSSILRFEEFIDKNLPLHRAPVIESLLLSFWHNQHEKIKRWVGIAVSRFVRELSVYSICFNLKLSDESSFPRSLYTCNSLVALKLQSSSIIVDVPRIVCLPSLKTLQLRRVTYSNEGSLGLLLSHCPVLEDLCIERKYEDDNLRAIVVNVPSLQRLNLEIGFGCSFDGYSIVTPSLKYLKIVDYRFFPSYLIEPMPELEEADIDVVQDIQKILESMTSVRRLSLRSRLSSAEESVYRAGVVFNQLEHLELRVYNNNWSKLLIWLLGNSPKLRVLNLCVRRYQSCKDYQPVNWKNTGSSVPECLLRSLETFEFKDYMGTQEEDRDFLSFFFKHARCLKSTSIIHHVP